MYATDWSLDFNSAPWGITTLHALMWRGPLDAREERWLKAARKEQRRFCGEQAKKYVPKHLRAIRAFPPWRVPENAPLLNPEHVARSVGMKGSSSRDLRRM